MTERALERSESREELERRVEGLRWMLWIMMLPVSDSGPSGNDRVDVDRRDELEAGWDICLEGVWDRGVAYAPDELRGHWLVKAVRRVLGLWGLRSLLRLADRLLRSSSLYDSTER